MTNPEKLYMLAQEYDKATDDEERKEIGKQFFELGEIMRVNGEVAKLSGNIIDTIIKIFDK